ncbi:YqaJ viral recombinase family protein [Marinobacter sp. LV10MA510-1]|uniref:YqaJ viral recombinase family nuclease n=1 Tax=Marinobacter sp. LV10MA510-1 TaxID=1415567 RepID=UPI000BF7292E|nr:YqaJ viral recombinase family protein [Marinobacter sp. LV10MA510-1]PFG11117.1 putative phage-type endonuclease [Marinobacter sp. LV10MA510-1]
MGMSEKVIQKQRPALRLVSTKDLSRDEWLKVRKQGIGSSDASAAIGINPYQSQLELWMVKTGRDASLPKPDSDDPSSPVYWGHVLEPIVAEQYSQQTGRKVRRVNAVLQHSDPDKHWMLANLDYSVAADDEVQILECKTAGEFGSRLWKEGVPDYIQCQVQHQLAVTGKQAADVCVLLCGQELKIYRIERNEELIDALVVLERQFWDFVETDTPPPTDGTDSADRALRHLYPVDKGETLDFSQSKDLSQAFDELLSIRSEMETLKSTESHLKQRIQGQMGEASKATFPSGSVSWKRSKDSVGLNTKKLLQDQPGLLNQYSITKSGSRRFLIQA